MEPILTQREIVVDLSPAAIEVLLRYMETAWDEGRLSRDRGQVAAELTNFYNLLRNLVERSKGEAPDNSDLI